MDNNVQQLYEEQASRLGSLREITKLNPIDYLRVLNARKQAERFRDLYIKQNPTDIIEVDYSVADDLEYSLRFGQLERDVQRSWREYIGLENDGYGLTEYAEDYLVQYMREHKQTNSRGM